MARRGFGGTALRAALGAVTGVAEGLQQRDVVAAEKKRMADAAAMDQARLLMQLNYRVAPPAYDTEDPAARSILPPLEMPSAAPSSGARAGGSLSAALNRGMGVDPTKPSLFRGLNADPLALDSRTTRMTEVLGRGQEARAAQEAIAASVTLPGGQKVRFNAPESAAQLTARKLADYEAQKKADAAIAAQAKADERKAKAQEERDLADAYVFAFTGKDGKPMPLTQALAAAKSGKTPLDLGFAQKPMTEEEQQRLFIMQGNLDVSRGQLGVARDRLALDKTKEGALKPAERFTGDYTQTLEKIADFLPTTDPKTGALIPPKRGLSSAKSFLTQQGSPERSFAGQVALIGSSALGYDTSEEQLYNTLAKEVATAYAMKEQQGRNVSNADLTNRQSQITVQPNEIGNLEIQKVKGDRLRQWAQTLQSGAPIPQVKAGETIVPPTLGETRESLRDAGFSEPEINAYFAKKGGGE
jgi:hypothetical protein